MATPDSVSYPQQPYGPAAQWLAAARNTGPLRNRLGKTFGGGLAGVANITGISGGVPLTFLMAVPIEAPCYAVRVGYGNPYNTTMTITKASVYPSSTYSNLDAMLAAQGASQTTVVPTGTGAPLYFDNNGYDNPILNTAGTNRGFTTIGDPTNGGNANAAFPILWSDWVPCTSIDRTDGGTNHLLFIYTTISSNNISKAAGLATSQNLTLGGYLYNNNGLANRQRKIFSGVAWTGSTDWADNPSGSAWKTVTVNPIYCVQYLTANPGLQILINGDSLSASPTLDGYSTPLTRAAAEMSTAAYPIEVCNMAWGGVASTVYEPLLRMNVSSWSPSGISFQPLSRNDTFTAAGLQTLLAKALANIATCRTAYGAVPIMDIAGGEPSADGNATQIAAFNDCRLRLQQMALNSGVLFMDSTGVTGDVIAGKPWNYISGVSNDNTHLNYAGAELCVPQARQVIQALRGF